MVAYHSNDPALIEINTFLVGKTRYSVPQTRDLSLVW